jgi:hypothetical protein
MTRRLLVSGQLLLGGSIMLLALVALSLVEVLTYLSSTIRIRSRTLRLTRVWLLIRHGRGFKRDRSND